MSPVFSIIIAAYNLGELVCDAIASCVKQKNMAADKYEILIFNDGSTDNTLEYIEKFHNVSNVTIVNQKNIGLSATRNKGIDMAKGEYILFLDGDDWLADDALSKLYKYVDNTSLIVFPMIYYYDKANQIVKEYGLQERIYGRQEFLHMTLGYSQFHIIPSQNSCYKRNVLIEHDVQFVEGILHEDNPFFIRSIFAFGQIKYVNEPIYYYRQNRQGSITSTCSIRNFLGVMAGNSDILRLTLGKNQDVNFLLGNMHVFQILGKYSKEEDRKQVYQYYRLFSTKWILMRLLFTSTYRWKHVVRLLLLIIDPAALNYVISHL